MENLAKDLLARARAADIKIATAESCTGGLLAGAITDIAGSSDVFDRGFVTYSNSAKVTLLGVEDSTLATFGAVSEETALQMADGALRRSDVDLTVAITGIAGPGGSEMKPEGRVCFAVAQIGQPTQTETVEFGAIGRREVRHASVAHALDLLSRAIQ